MKIFKAVMASSKFKIVLSHLIVTTISLFIALNLFSTNVPIQCPEQTKESDHPELIALKLLSEEEDYPSNVNKLEQDNPILVKYAYFRHLTPPSKEPYNLLGSPEDTYENGYSLAVNKLFKGKKNGTFIEAGAYDGVAASNTLFFEKILGWSGLLVECNPMTVPFLKMKRRKAWIANVCLSPFKHPATVNFSNPTAWTPSAKMGLPADLSKYGVDTAWTQFQVQALPLFTLLSAINLTTIDFLSLDVEGAELDILKTIPFERVNITAIFLEVDHFNGTDKSNLQAYLASKGYERVKDFESDELYLHSSYHDIYKYETEDPYQQTLAPVPPTTQVSLYPGPLPAVPQTPR